MTCAEFVAQIMDYDFGKMIKIYQDSELVDGGIEGWIQVEFQIHLKEKFRAFGGADIHREIFYPGSPERCDFLLATEEGEVYIELKCLNPYDKDFNPHNPNYNPVEALLGGVQEDISKIKGFGVNGMCIAIVMGTDYEFHLFTEGIRGYMEEVYSEECELCIQSIEENLSEDSGEQLWIVGVPVAG